MPLPFEPTIDLPSLDAAPPPVRSMGSRTARGVIWFALSLLVSRASTFLAQLALGWILSKREFGLYALAIACSTIVVILKDGGTRKILIYESERYAQLARPVFLLSMAFNLTAGVLLAFAAPLAARWFDAPGLTPVIVAIAISLPLSTFGTVQRAKLAADLRFKAISSLTASSAVIRQISVVAFALLGFGPLSFTLPLIVIALYEGVAGRYLAGALSSQGRLTWDLTVDLLKKSRWMMLSGLALSLTLQGDYLVVGALKSEEVLGVYFFAFQLTVAISTPFASSIAAVLTPSLTGLKNDSKRQAQAYEKAVRVLSMVSAPICVAAAVTAGPLIHLFWNGKWDSAVPAVVVLSLSLPVWLLTPIAMSLIESRGQWRLSAILLGVDAVLTMAAAGAGALLGGPVSIAAWISGERIVLSLVACVVAGRLVSASKSGLISAIFVPIVTSIICGGIAFWTMSAMLPAAAWIQLVARGILVAIVLAAVGGTALRDRLLEVISFAASSRQARVMDAAPAPIV